MGSIYLWVGAERTNSFLEAGDKQGVDMIIKAIVSVIWIGDRVSTILGVH